MASEYMHNRQDNIPELDPSLACMPYGSLDFASEVNYLDTLRLFWCRLQQAKSKAGEEDL
ncbi:hypothetical protein COCSUDRAFT_61813 [Coccomyxa subellipsoidea C-169]|uniref:Uncharacterized protein n=1 Tax=Coccomyxa subellipsoidea (strain C-169) TaxID=574566 RepID=I0Z169_COCSC|nr:hypothetical protein COCSUDRAFT_61813 [Coccomyxa subellipsoidea C-169]EIE24388.1 hypothetical protein COCSUDRAFT_61813 [Coccomyxa subellipsoidea C-169]|eukprot:XP_005648932.1 hypothetical protein COCSUDRAFT_61813 [Coccomyxa subellipsoidea C-169]